MPSHDATVGAAILAAADAQAGEGVALLASLVRQRSLLGEEHGALDAMAAAFETLGLTPRRVAVDVDALAGRPGFSPPLRQASTSRAKVGSDRGAPLRLRTLAALQQPERVFGGHVRRTAIIGFDLAHVARQVRRRCKARRIQLFMVPSGTPAASASEA